jgi:hypothetical protein
MKMAAAKKTKAKIEKDEGPRAFVEDMMGTVRRHWKFFLGFILGAVVTFYLF